MEWWQQGDSASFYVGVRHPQLQSTTRGASRLRVKPATGDMEAEAVADSSDDEAEDAWQPADSDDSTDTIEQVGRTPSISERTPSISEVCRTPYDALKLQKGLMSKANTSHLKAC